MTKPMRSVTKDLVQYQDGAIVSRMLIDKLEGNVTVFSIKEGQGISEHVTPYDAMVQILEGKAQITIAGVEYELEEGEMIIMPANDPHSLRAVESFKMLLTMIKSK